MADPQPPTHLYRTSIVVRPLSGIFLRRIPASARSYVSTGLHLCVCIRSPRMPRVSIKQDLTVNSRIFSWAMMKCEAQIGIRCESSFNDKPINEGVVGPIGKDLFEKEQDDLLTDLKDIPNKACDRRINEFKRARAAKIHSYIISHLKKEMPVMMGKAKTQQGLIDNLADEFAKKQPYK